MTRSRDNTELPNPDSVSRNTPSNSTSHMFSPQQGNQAVDLHSPSKQYDKSLGILNQENETDTSEETTITDQIFENSPIFDWDKDTAFRQSARYYGPTSFSAVFSEGAKLSEDLDIGEARRKHPANWPFGQPLLGRERPSAPSVRMHQVLKALWNIPSREMCEKLLGTFDSLHHYLMNSVMIRHCIETLWSSFGAELDGPRTYEKLARIANVLFKNEEMPLSQAPEDGMDWLNGFMGQNLRFEMMGMLFCFFGMSYQTLQDWDEIFQAPENGGRDRKETSWRMKECADICLKMCEISEENNEISIALMVCNAVLESVCTGDESFQLRRRHGDLVVCSIAAGIHKLPDYASRKVTTASEWKTRLFAVVYTENIDHASLNGTPPALSARYCNIRTPYDISDEDLFLPQVELAKVVAKLDHNGWDSSGSQLHHATFHRVRQLLAENREEILEISLGIDVLLSQDRIDDLYRRCQEIYDNLPEQVKYHPQDKIPAGTSARTYISQAYLTLNWLQSRLLIDRIAVTRGFPQNGQRLLNTALELIDLTNMFWIKRDQLMLWVSAFDWIFTCYGIPAAGVICVELLRQATGQSVLQFSRSDAIQKLTMFIGFLAWIRPTDGNYLLAGRLKRVITRILDRVLDSPSQLPAGHGMIDVPIDPMLAPFVEMDWWNTIDWTQGSPWMGSN